MRKLKIKNEKLKISASARLMGLLRSIRLISLIALIAMGVLTSCNHKEFCYDHPHGVKLQLVYDWRDAPDANPAGMCVFFYPLDTETTTPIRMDFSNSKGGEIELKPGTYLVLTYNNDTEAVQFGGDQAFDTHFGYTRTGHILEPLYGNALSTANGNGNFLDEPVVITPDELWGCSETNVVVTGVENQTITLYPHDMLCHYSYEVRNVPNLNKVAKMSGALTGMAPALYLAEEYLDDEPVTLPVEAWADGETTIRGEFLTFGQNEELQDPHRMAFYVEMIDGTRYSFTTASNLDVTDQVHSAPNRRRVHLIIDGLPIPTPMEGGSGLAPEVEDWQEELEDIQL